MLTDPTRLIHNYLVELIHPKKYVSAPISFKLNLLDMSFFMTSMSSSFWAARIMSSTYTARMLLIQPLEFRVTFGHSGTNSAVTIISSLITKKQFHLHIDLLGIILTQCVVCLDHIYFSSAAKSTFSSSQLFVG